VAADHHPSGHHDPNLSCPDIDPLSLSLYVQRSHDPLALYLTCPPYPMESCLQTDLCPGNPPVHDNHHDPSCPFLDGILTADLPSEVVAHGQIHEGLLCPKPLVVHQIHLTLCLAHAHPLGDLPL